MRSGAYRRGCGDGVRDGGRLFGAGRDTLRGDSAAMKSFRRQCLAWWVLCRSRWPAWIQDAITHLPSRVAESTPRINQDRG